MGLNAAKKVHLGAQRGHGGAKVRARGAHAVRADVAKGSVGGKGGSTKLSKSTKFTTCAHPTQHAPNCGPYLGGPKGEISKQMHASAETK
jgi:hypothetical protein